MRYGCRRFGRHYCRPNPRICIQEGLPTFYVLLILSFRHVQLLKCAKNFTFPMTAVECVASLSMMTGLSFVICVRRRLRRFRSSSSSHGRMMSLYGLDMLGAPSLVVSGRSRFEQGACRRCWGIRCSPWLQCFPKLLFGVVPTLDKKV